MPKQYVITLDSADDVRILRILLEAQLLRFKLEPSKHNDVALVAQRVIEACGTVEEVITKTSNTTTPVVSINLCTLHPHYQARRRPRSDCEGCWSAYERLNGSDAARLAKLAWKRSTEKSKLIHGQTEDHSHTPSKPQAKSTGNHRKVVSRKSSLQIHKNRRAK